MDQIKKYDESIFNFIEKIELNKYSDIFIDNLLNKCEEECQIIGIELIDSNNFNILINNCIKDTKLTIISCPLIIKNLVYSYIIMRIYNYKCIINHSDIIDKNILLQDYSEFVDLSEQEITYLLKFRNLVKIIINLFETKMIKQLCINIASILEGSGKKYICGSGQTQQTNRRVNIFRKEAKINPIKRSSNYKRNRSQSLSDINVKMIYKKKKKSIHNIFKNNLTDYMTNINKNINIILYDEKIEKHILRLFNSELFNDLNTY
jgi:hypothetical protein